MWNPFRKPAEAKASATGAILHRLFLGQPVWTPRNYEQLADEAYVRNVVAYTCISRIARSCGSVRLWLYRGRDSQPVEAHPLLRLMERPNPMQGGAAFIERVVSFHQIAGISHIEAVGPLTGDNAGHVQELYSLRPDRMKIEIGRDGFPSAYIYEVSAGLTKRFPVNVARGRTPVHAWRSFHPTDDVYGLGRIEPAAYAVDIHNKSSAHNKALLDNEARPSGALMLGTESPPTEEELADIRREVEKVLTGVDNTGRPLILGGKMTWQQLGLSSRDGDFIEMKNTVAREICAAFGYPAQLLDVPGSNTYSNLKEARLVFWEDTVLPLLDSLLDELNTWLAPRFGDDSLRLGYDADAIPALAPRREKSWEFVERADFLTINEKREMFGYPKVEAGDEVLVPATMVPLGFEPTDEETDESGLEDDPDDDDPEEGDDPEDEPAED